jgi:hypothetical protein
LEENSDMRDPWLPRLPSFKVCLKKGRARLRWVSQLMKPNQREWGVDVIKSCLDPVDVDEVLKLRLSDRGDEDCIAWHYERSGLFSVKSAYKLARMAEQESAYKLARMAEQEELVQARSSSRTDGSRGMYNEIWATPMPPKVTVFVWKLSQEGLTEDATCHLCGRWEEDGHHAVIGCTKATALRKELRRFLQLPDEAQFRWQGPDWFLVLLSRVKKEVRANILLLLWRAWFLRNNVTHDTGEATLQGSVMFLQSYCESVSQEGLHPPIPKNEKGKQSVMEGRVKGQCAHHRGTQQKEHNEAWKPPPQGWIKLNTDAGFCIQMG